MDGDQPAAAAARHLPPPAPAGHHPGGATTLGERTPPRTGSSFDGGSWLLPSSTPPRAPPSQVVVVDLLPLQGVWWVLLAGNLYSPLLLLPRWPACSSPSPSPPPPPPPSPAPGLGPCTSLSSPWTILTLSRAGCLCSAFELRRFVAVDDAIFTASVFCLVRGFLCTDITLMSKFSIPPCASGWKSLRCLKKALDSF